MTEEQKQYIKDNSKSMYVNEISDELGLGYFRVYNFILRNNLRRKKVQPRDKQFQFESEYFEHTWLI